MTISPYVPPAWLSSLPSGVWSGVGGLPVLPFLPGQTPEVTKAPTWSTKVKRAASGRERRTAFWPYPLWTFELKYELIRHKPTAAELFAMWEFFNVQQGQFLTWLFVDPSDNQVAASSPQTFGVGDGATTAFQLTRSINSFVEPVFAAYAPTVKVAGAATSAYSLSGGAITFASAPASGAVLTWSGYFYVGCLFLLDVLSFSQFVNLLLSCSRLKFSSVRV